MLALVREGDYTPSAEHVALRADVSLRTVFRHFEDMDRLYREMIVPIEAELLQIVAKPFRASDWKGQIVELVERRSGAYEAITPYRRAADAHRHKSQSLASENQRFADVARLVVQQILPAEQRDPYLLDALDMLLSYEAWSRLRREQDLPVERAREVLETTIRKLIG